MKLIIDGSNISSTKVDVYLDEKIFCTKYINHNLVEIMIEDTDMLSSIECRFWTVMNNMDDAAEAFCDAENMINEEGINEDLVCPDLQYPYISKIEYPCNKESLKLSPERMVEFGDFIIFVLDDDKNAMYIRKEDEIAIRTKIRADIKKDIIDFARLYPFAVIIAALCVVIPNYIDSYSLSRLLGPIFFFAVLALPIGAIRFTRKYIKMRNFLLAHPQLSLKGTQKN